mmetsp:Transcript_97049/g.270937  ORF Transcript_97049/g.270937 Transcript_97049/m.270937 type:complete len:201 (-) Transcript_97049:738-1340(-)
MRAGLWLSSAHVSTTHLSISASETRLLPLKSRRVHNFCIPLPLSSAQRPFSFFSSASKSANDFFLATTPLVASAGCFLVIFEAHCLSVSNAWLCSGETFIRTHMQNSLKSAVPPPSRSSSRKSLWRSPDWCMPKAFMPAWNSSRLTSPSPELSISWKTSWSLQNQNMLRRRSWNSSWCRLWSPPSLSSSVVSKACSRASG